MHLLDRLHPLVPLAMHPTPTQPLWPLLLTDNQHEGDLLHFGLADLVAELLVARIEFRPESGRLEALRRQLSAYSMKCSDSGSTIACTGASQNGKFPA